jgi:uncharacterized repeat protein (TIGR03847 family)
MPQHIELNPVSHLTIGAVGPPGERVFYIQGSRGTEIITLIMEKQQARMLANGLESLLEELQERFPGNQREAPDTVWTDLRLRQPLEPIFRIGNMGLGFNEESSRIVVVAYELVEEEEEPNVVSFWTSRSQVKSLIPHIQEVVSAGRPICGNCGQPMDPGGHFCPRRNGHMS